MEEFNIDEMDINEVDENGLEDMADFTALDEVDVDGVELGTDSDPYMEQEDETSNFLYQVQEMEKFLIQCLQEGRQDILNALFEGTYPDASFQGLYTTLSSKAPILNATYILNNSFGEALSVTAEGEINLEVNGNDLMTQVLPVLKSVPFEKELIHVSILAKTVATYIEQIEQIAYANAEAGVSPSPREAMTNDVEAAEVLMEDEDDLMLEPEEGTPVEDSSNLFKQEFFPELSLADYSNKVIAELILETGSKDFDSIISFLVSEGFNRARANEISIILRYLYLDPNN